MINLLSQTFNKLDITIAIHVFELKLIENNYVTIASILEVNYPACHLLSGQATWLPEAPR
jgi:hypothetical protein